MAARTANARMGNSAMTESPIFLTTMPWNSPTARVTRLSWQTREQAGGVAKLVEVCRRPDDVRKEDRDLALVAPEFLVDLGAGLKKLVEVYLR